MLRLAIFLAVAAILAALGTSAAHDAAQLLQSHQARVIAAGA